MVAESQWTAGRLDRDTGKKQVLFGRVYEDAAIESSVFAPGTRIFCIASAGCTAIRLSVNRDVTAVDINPVQLDYARRRAGGAPMQEGVAEMRMAFARRFLPLVGWTPGRIEVFLGLEDPVWQLHFWNDYLNTRRMQWALDALLSTRSLQAGYQSSLLHALPAHFGAVLRSRLERGWASHSNRENIYARALLSGDAPPVVTDAKSRPISFICADAAQYLEMCPAGSFDGFALSNILDGCSPPYRERLKAAVRHAGSKGSILVRRSFSEPDSTVKENLAERDRSLLWGVVEVLPTDRAQ